MNKDKERLEDYRTPPRRRQKRTETSKRGKGENKAYREPIKKAKQYLVDREISVRKREADNEEKAR